MLVVPPCLCGRPYGRPPCNLPGREAVENLPDRSVLITGTHHPGADYSGAPDGARSLSPARLRGHFRRRAPSGFQLPRLSGAGPMRRTAPLRRHWDIIKDKDVVSGVYVSEECAVKRARGAPAVFDKGYGGAYNGTRAEGAAPPDARRVARAVARPADSPTTRKENRPWP